MYYTTHGTDYLTRVSDLFSMYSCTSYSQNGTGKAFLSPTVSFVKPLFIKNDHQPHVVDVTPSMKRMCQPPNAE